MMVKKPASIKKLSKKSPAKQKDLFYNVKNYSFGQSRAYLFEYGLLLLAVGALIGLIVSMVQQITRTVASEQLSSALSSVDFSNAVLTLSAVIVLLPLTIVLIQRTAETERANPLIKNTGWRKAFLGIFLATISITAVVASIYFVNSVMAYLTGSINTMDWGQTVGLGFTALVVTLAAWSFGNDYRHVPARSNKSLHFARYGLVLSALVISSLFIMLPMTEYRDEQKRGVVNTTCSEDNYGDYKFKEEDDIFYDDSVQPLPLEEY